MRIAVDAMGGDFGPPVTVPGSLMAAQELGIVPYLVGKKTEIEREIKRFPSKGIKYEIVEAEETITMEDSPISAVKKKKSSIRVGIELHKNGICSGFISAGNSGAVLAISIHLLGKIKGIERPAIMTRFPRVGGGYTALLDMGGNVDCKPRHLLDFAVMGSIYVRNALGIPDPKVGLLSNGEEKGKGNRLTKEAYSLFESYPSLNFIGYVEGRDIFFGDVDVVICDGFVGNIVLKVTEGVAEAIYTFMKEEISKSSLSKLGILLARPSIKRFLKKVDYAEYGGAPLLGVDGVCFISHGRSSPRAIRNGIAELVDFCGNGIIDLIKSSIQEN